MKKLFRPFLMVATVATLFVVSSCTKTCDEGYEGTDCKTEVRAKLLGDYNASEKKNGGTPYSYSGEIKTSSTVTEVYISRIPNGTGFFNNDVKASVSGNTLTINSQEPDDDKYYIEGTGTFTAGTPAKIEFVFTVKGPDSSTPPVTITDNYTATWTAR